jgi:membrane-associated phospholipid phosphatase
MPSLHMGWSTWSALALLPVLRRPWLKVLVCLDPVLTFFAIVVTANHWILDAIGGWVALAIAYGLAVVIERLCYDTSRRRPVSTS